MGCCCFVSQLIPPWGSVPFIPPYHKNLENTRVRLRVLDVDHCPWSVYSLASVDEDLQTIEFIPHHHQQGAGTTNAGTGVNSSPQLHPASPRSTDGASVRKTAFLQRLPTKSLVNAALAAAAVVGASSNSANPPQLTKGYLGAGGVMFSEAYPDADEDPYTLQDGDVRWVARANTQRGTHREI